MAALKSRTITIGPRMTRRFHGFTLTGTAPAGGSVVLTDPNGDTFLNQTLALDDSVTLSGIFPEHLAPGDWQLTVTGNIDGTVTVA